jgi:hypothetical protein
MQTEEEDEKERGKLKTGSVLMEKRDLLLEKERCRTQRLREK